MIPILYNESETIFGHNGVGQLYETMDYTVTEERNGSFTLELEYPADGRWANEIKDHRIISAKPNDIDEPHLFRINEIIKDLETQTILIFADTKTNDLAGNMIIDVSVVDQNAQQALNAIKAGAIEPITYNLLSDITTLSSSSWTNLNPLSCLSGTQGSIVSNWGGEIKRTNNAIHIYGRRGIDNSARIYPGHGLDGFKMTVSTKGLVTHILPYVMYTRENDTEPTMVRGFVVASPLAPNYPIKSIIAVDFSGYDELFPEGELSDTVYENAVKSRLDSKAAGYFTYLNPDIDKPKVTVDVDLSALSDSSEYEHFKTLEHIGLTDTVDIWIEDYNIDVNLKIHTVSYSGLTEMVKSFKAGSVKHGIYSDVNATYEDKIDAIKEYIGTVENGIYNTIRESADGKTNIFSGYTTPDPSTVKNGDLWYKQLGSGEVEMYRWDGASWVIAVGNADKLAMGTIDANLINLINLNANNITTGTIQGANGAWNLNTGVLYLGSSLADAKLIWDGTNLTIRASQTVQVGSRNIILDSRVLPTSQGIIVEHLGVRCDRIMATYDAHTSPAEKYSMPLRVGDKVVLSVDVAYTGTKPSMIEFYMGPAIFNYTPAKGLEKLDSVGKFVRIYVDSTVTADAPYTRIRVRMSGSNTSSYVYFANWKLEKGTIPTDWSAAPEELYTGITRIDQDGINVSQSDSALNTQIAYNGITISDKSSIISSFGDSGAVIPFADIEKFKSNDITRTFRESITLNVGPGYTFTSISAALDYCFTDTIRVLLDNAVIILNVYGQFFDDVILRGITGSGAVRINMANSSTRWIGSFHAIDCSARVYIAGANSIFKGGSTNGWAIFNENSKFLSIADLNIDNTDSTYAIRTSDGGRTTVMSVDISGGNSGFYASYGGEIKIRACRGNVTHNGCLTRTNGTIYARESTPVGYTNWNNLDGFLYREANTVALASAFNKPPVTSKTFTKTFTVATFDTLHNGVSVDSYYGATGAQNRWSGMSGWKQARIRMGSEISSFISGGSSVQTQIRLRRKNSSHGSSGGITPTPSHGMSSATQGAWTGWGVISSSYFGSSVDLRFGSDTYSNYAIWDAIEVWVSVVKSV